MKQQSFPLEDVLAVAFDKQFSATKNGIVSLCNFLLSTEISDQEIPTILKYCCRPLILRQHPELQEIDISSITDDNYWGWIAEQRSKYGSVVSLTSLLL